jgi:hypothetical protein
VGRRNSARGYRRYAVRRQDGAPLIVDLTNLMIESEDDLWDALSKECGLPDWFGRNLNAWIDTIDAGGISEVIDDHPLLIVRLRRTGIFELGDSDGEAFVEVTNRSDYGSVVFIE